MDRTYLIEYSDSGDAEMRARHREAHIAYRKSLGNRMLLAGPILDAQDATVGSLILIQASDPETAQQVALGDPLVAAAVLELRSVRPYRIARMVAP